MSKRLMNLVLLMFSSMKIDITVAIGTCSPACVSCINDTCVTCTQGNYLESGSCYTCPERCTSCTNPVVCYNCTEGYYGLSCDNNCNSLMCINNTCDKDGICLHGCIDGYFLSGSSCYQCASNCKTCANFSNNCLECKEGYYGPTCQYPCSHCKDSICTRDSCTYGFYRGNEACNSCYINCTSCLLLDHCTACVEGYFGHACQVECTDCSPCNQDGSCPTKTLRSSVPATTSLISSMSQSARPNYVESTTQSYPVTTKDSNHEGEYQQKKPMDNTIKYAVGGSVGGIFAIVMIAVAVFVAKRWSEVKRTSAHINNQARESDGTSHDYTTLAMETRQGDGHVYSGLDNAPTIVTMETMSTTRDHSDQETHYVLPQKYVCDKGPGYYSNVN